MAAFRTTRKPCRAGVSHRQSYFDIAMVGIIGAVLALIAVIWFSSP